MKFVRRIARSRFALRAGAHSIVEPSSMAINRSDNTAALPASPAKCSSPSSVICRSSPNSVSAPCPSCDSNRHRDALDEWLSGRSGLTLPVYPIGGTLAECDPFAIPSTSLWTAAAIIGQSPDEELHRHAAKARQADALLFGRVTYEMMEEAWRPVARAGARPEWMEPFARTIHAAKKYVVSSTLDRVDWNAELVRGDLQGRSRLKQRPGKGCSREA